MANIIAVRTLKCPELNTTQIVGFVEGLDISYNGTIRNVVWAAYEGSDETGVLVFQDSTTLANCIDSEEFVFSGLEANTEYYLIVKISNISGYNSDDYVLYKGTQSTAESGGVDYSQAPSITSFKINGTSAREQTVENKEITYSFTMTGLWEEYSSGSFSRYSYAGMKLCKKSVFDSSGLTYSGDYVTKIESIGTDVFYWVAPYGSSDEFTLTEKNVSKTQYDIDEPDTYVIILYAVNEKNSGGEYDTYGTYKTRIIEVLDDSPNCTLNVVFADKVYSYDDERVTGIIHNYPFITAENWNQFCEDINTCRTNSQLGMGSYSFTTVVKDTTKMTSDILNEAYEAIYEIYETYGNSMGVTMPSNFEEARQGYQTVEAYFNGLNVAIQTVRDVLFGVTS